ncbi:EscU/YscU/HrcU family type III secretion system export apparatus switch protein [Pseudoalteromonas marina]|uniref:Flagellar biosynthetic protein FlhB n=1 Tax=Pseudoalteromonas marina TaxID=267375 RepID=A0ABT9FC12_9GAMM|nr:flagellar type III secretion system protein FlhB [Pseudoalteromonas marina]MDP2564325.1 flagellar type III secretion system protein FlhB [Pseudoalteromonas marina]
MSDEDKDSKTFDPSQKKLQDAKKKGQTVRSKELSNFITLLVCVIFYYAVSPFMEPMMHEWFDKSFTFNKDVLYSDTDFLERIKDSFFNCFLIVMVMLIVVGLGSFFGNLIIGGWVFAPKNAFPKMEKVSPLKGLKRMFSMKTVVELIKSLLKLTLLAAVSYLLIKIYLTELLTMSFLSIDDLGSFSLDLAALYFSIIVLSLLGVVVVDAPYQFFEHISNLKMSYKDLKDENKELEGDPHQKGYMRQKQREISSAGMLHKIKDADVVVTNPTHYSVAIAYAGGDEAPIVVASGVDSLAFKIREIAKEHKVQVLESPELARSLYKHVEIGKSVPESLFEAVALVITYIKRLEQYTVEQKIRNKKMIRKINVPKQMKYEGKNNAN